MLVSNLFCRSLILSFFAFGTTLAFAEPAMSELSAAVNSAWQRSPQARMLEARRNEIAASGEAAYAWIAGSPSIGLSQRSDWPNAPSTERETEVSLSAPIWLPGQKWARQTLLQFGADDLEAQIANARLTLAGEVRERLWAVAAAREFLSEAQARLEYFHALNDEVVQRVQVGDLADIDSMLAQQEVLAARAAVGVARTRINEALARYYTLTGQAYVSQSIAEPIGQLPADSHPSLLAARTALQRAQAELGLVNASSSDQPTVGVSVRNEQDAILDSTNRTIGLSIQIPISNSARNRPLEAAARTQIEAARSALAQAQRELQANIDLARNQLEVAQEILEVTSSRSALTRDYAQSIEKAFRLGERGLADVLRARTLAHEAHAAQEQQRVTVGLAHARLNQALGILP